MEDQHGRKAELLRLLHQEEPDTTGSPADIRRRAFSVWHEAYTLVADTGRYLERRSPAVDRRFPRVSPERVPARPADPPPQP